MADLNALVDSLSELTVLEASELSKMLEEKWGVSAAAAVAAPAAARAWTPFAATAAAAAQYPQPVRVRNLAAEVLEDGVFAPGGAARVLF